MTKHQDLFQGGALAVMKSLHAHSGLGEIGGAGPVSQSDEEICTATKAGTPRPAIPRAVGAPMTH